MRLFLLLILFTGFAVHAQENSYAQPKSSSEVILRPVKRTYRKNVVQVEALGRGFFYGLSYERMVSPQASLGIGFSYAVAHSSIGFFDTTFQVMSLPLYFNYYTNPGRHNLVFTGGVNILAFEAKVKTNDTQIAALGVDNEEYTYSLGEAEFKGSAVIPVPQAGMGYEYRGTSGFMTRTNLYAVYVINRIVPWLGFSVGVAF